MKKRIFSALCALGMALSLVGAAWVDTYTISLTAEQASSDVPVLLDIPTQTPAGVGESFNRIEITAPVKNAAVEITVTGEAKNASLFFLNSDGTYEVAEELIKGTNTVCTMLPETSATLILLKKMAFTDVSASNWYYAAAAYAYHNGLMNGTSSTKFSPSATAERAMLVTILWRTQGSPEAAAADFSDVAAGKYYTEAVSWAAENNIVTGFANGTFRPTGKMNREQLAVVLYRYAQFRGDDVSARADLSAYSDANQVSSYAADAMSWAVAEGLISGNSGKKLTPAGTATRAQLAPILMRFFGNEPN